MVCEFCRYFLESFHYYVVFCVTMLEFQFFELLGQFSCPSFYRLVNRYLILQVILASLMSSCILLSLLCESPFSYFLFYFVSLLSLVPCRQLYFLCYCLNQFKLCIVSLVFPLSLVSLTCLFTASAPICLNHTVSLSVLPCVVPGRLFGFIGLVNCCLFGLCALL